MPTDQRRAQDGNDLSSLRGTVAASVFDSRPFLRTVVHGCTACTCRPRQPPRPITRCRGTTIQKFSSYPSLPPPVLIPRSDQSRSLVTLRRAGRARRFSSTLLRVPPATPATRKSAARHAPLSEDDLTDTTARVLHRRIRARWTDPSCEPRANDQRHSIEATTPNRGTRSLRSTATSVLRSAESVADMKRPLRIDHHFCSIILILKPGHARHTTARRRHCPDSILQHSARSTSAQHHRAAG